LLFSLKLVLSGGIGECGDCGVERGPRRRTGADRYD